MKKMSNLRQSKTDEEWEELINSFGNEDSNPCLIKTIYTPKEWKRILEVHAMEQKALKKTEIEKQTVGGLDWYFRSEVGIKLPTPNPNKVYYNSNTCSVYDEYNTLLGYGEILNEVFN
jgi:hypothetical protein